MGRGKPDTLRRLAVLGWKKKCPSFSQLLPVITNSIERNDFVTPFLSTIAFQRHMGPSRAPHNGGNLKGRSAVSGIIGVKNHDVPFFLLKDRFAARPNPALISRKQQRSTSLQHR